MGRGLGFCALILAIEIPLGLAIAKFIPKRGKLAAIAFVLISLPLVVPWVTAGLMWLLMLRSGGVVPVLLSNVGLHFSITNPTQLFLAIVVVDAWHWVPLVALMFTAGYAAMPKEPIQAAKIDGASNWRIFRHIELPALKFPLLMAVLIRFMDSFRIFDEPYIIAGDGPYHCVEFLSTNVYGTTLGAFNFGYGAACSLIYFFLALAIVFVLMMIITRGRGVLGR